MTTRVGVVYFSAEGTTAALADALSRGASGVAETEVLPLRITGETIRHGRLDDEAMLERLDGCAAVVFGSPTYMGGPAAQFKAFADATSERWVDQRWRDKLAAGFTAGASPAGDQLATLQYFALLAAQHGMLWIGLDLTGGPDPHGRNRLGSQLGVASCADGSTPHADDLATARYLGERVARLCGRMTGG